MDINNDEHGSVSIESLLVLPVIILIYVSFIQLITYFKVSDTRTHDMVNEILENQIKEYKEYKFFLFGDENFENNKKEIYDKQNSVLLEFKFFLTSNILGKKYIDFKEEKIVRKFESGDSLKNYKLNSNIIKSNENIWELPNLKRAQEISKILGGTIDFNGNSVDKLENNKIVSIVSMDTRKITYSEKNRILTKLKTDIDRLVKFEEGKIDGKWINIRDYKAKVLHLVIPDVDIDSNLEMELLRVRNYCRNKNIEFKISILTGG